MNFQIVLMAVAVFFLLFLFTPQINLSKETSSFLIFFGGLLLLGNGGEIIFKDDRNYVLSNRFVNNHAFFPFISTDKKNKLLVLFDGAAVVWFVPCCKV